MNRKPPQPPVQAFLLCHEILHDARTNKFVLIGPVAHLPMAQFPCRLRLSAYLQLKCGHGRYELEFQLRTGDGNALWQWQPEPLDHPDPLFPNFAAYYDLVLGIPEPGRYDLVLCANGEDLAFQSLCVGPREFFLGNLETGIG